MESKDLAIVAVFGIAAILAIAMLLRPAVSAWARRIAGEGANPRLEAEVAELRERLAALEQPSPQLQELEERVDFAERLLAQRAESAPLPLSRHPTETMP